MKSPKELAEESNAKWKDAAAEEMVEPEVKKKTTTDIVLNDGHLSPQTLAEATRIAQGLISSECIPKQFDTVAKVIMGMQTLRQLGLPDIACLPRLCIIRGSFSIWGEAPKAVCEALIEDFKEFWFDAEYNIICFGNKNLKTPAWGAICYVKRTGRDSWIERTFTEDDAIKAKLWKKQGPWTEYPDRMLQMRARSWALKDAFPDKLMGVGIAEYDHNMIIDAEVNKEDRAPELVNRFKEEKWQGAT